jgi:hypothetical protein
MKIFEIMVLVGLCAMIALGSWFSFAVFSTASVEGNSTHEAETLNAHMQINSWSLVISALLIVAVIVLALKLLRDSPS